MPVNGGGKGSPWVPLNIQAWAPSLWRRIRYKGPLSSYTHNFIRILNPIPRQRLRIALYNHLGARSMVTCRRGMGFKIPPWGKGLIAKNICITCVLRICVCIRILFFDPSMDMHSAFWSAYWYTNCSLIPVWICILCLYLLMDKQSVFWFAYGYSFCFWICVWIRILFFAPRMNTHSVFYPCMDMHSIFGSVSRYVFLVPQMDTHSVFHPRIETHSVFQICILIGILFLDPCMDTHSVFGSTYGYAFFKSANGYTFWFLDLRIDKHSFFGSAYGYTFCFWICKWISILFFGSGLMRGVKRVYSTVCIYIYVYMGVSSSCYIWASPTTQQADYCPVIYIY